MSISLVIPVWNDIEGLNRLLFQVGKMGLFSEVIISDDASDAPITADMLQGAAELDARLVIVRSDQQRGAGHARNLGLNQVSGSHVIFFDSDDVFGPDFPQIVTALNEQKTSTDFDFCIFRHNDSRVLDRGGEGSFEADERLWRSVGARDEPRLLTPREASTLCRIAAYPWNKIYRTAFLRENSIYCTETAVHNDIELHWTSFLLGKTILCTSMIGAEHFVASTGSRLTNRRSIDRLEVFRAFENVQVRLDGLPLKTRLRYFEPVMRFFRELITWIRDNLEDEHHPILRQRAQSFFLDHLDGDLMTLLAYRNPAIADRINRLIAEGDLG